MRRSIRFALIGLAAASLMFIVGWQALDWYQSQTAPTATGDVLIITNRQQTDAEDPGDRFGGERGPVQHLRCSINYRPIPLTDSLAGQMDFFVPTEFKQVDAATRLDRQAFDAAIAARGDKPVVLFVHGYAYGFARACRMGAEMQRMLDDRATVVLFSWPSDANPADYVADQVDMEWSVPALTDELSRLSNTIGSDRLRVVAHSLGTRGVLFALAWHQLEQHAGPIASHLVLLAPDYDAEAFASQFKHIRPMFDHITTYASNNDAPLKVSEALHDHRRLGQAGPALSVIEGMQTIDVSGLGRYHPTGHEYFFYHPSVAADLVELLTLGRLADQRALPLRQTRDALPFWSLNDRQVLAD